MTEVTPAMVWDASMQLLMPERSTEVPVGAAGSVGGVLALSVILMITSRSVIRDDAMRLPSAVGETR